MIISELNYLEAVSTTSLLGGTAKQPSKPQPKKYWLNKGNHSFKLSNIVQNNIAINVAIGGSISNYQVNSAKVKQ